MASLGRVDSHLSLAASYWGFQVRADSGLNAETGIDHQTKVLKALKVAHGRSSSCAQTATVIIEIDHTEQFGKLSSCQ
ncbi:uncharacterized protein BP01DRAFT_386963 [Aspergillus saccharolyticus JOP 1030-1]|uniref:Uncharacterized protein n=1 Tax=Aspergillus saccharolyticus JOP 1030-1 TaxID=1450539 RepID=A0A318Z1R1_9EURO|nr:hypothetical protein BP01DRAFT_386963 [Aspergillus saccharolyticus JOP 1030-1]PYH40859.1 hypothetical protein BP01DRAFT_386963 [Aspergillus saccharolyticus JOP 1030-1]